MKKIILSLMLMTGVLLSACSSTSHIEDVKSGSLLMCSKYTIEQVLNATNIMYPETATPVKWAEQDGFVVAFVGSTTYYFKIAEDGYELTTIDSGVGLRPLSSYGVICGQLALHYYMHPDDAS